MSQSLEGVTWLNRKTNSDNLAHLKESTKCTKVKFASEKLAMADIKRVKKKIKEGTYKDRGKIPIRSYWCKECRCYHLTSKENKF